MSFTEIIIPASYMTIGVSAFYIQDTTPVLSNVVFEEDSKLTNIARSAFYGLDSLTHISNGLRYISLKAL